MIFFAGCIAALCTFMLWTKHLIIVYLYMISIGIIFISYWFNFSTIKAVIAYVSKSDYTINILDDILHFNLTSIIKDGTGSLLVQNYILQCLLASIFCYIHFAPRYFILQKLLVMSFMAPSLLAIHPIFVSKNRNLLLQSNNYHRFFKFNEHSSN